jgi:hypothetical protein
MGERCICPDYDLRGREYEVWTDGSRGSGGYPNWWLAGGHKPGWVLTEDDFDPALTNSEVTKISEYVYDRLAG